MILRTPEATMGQAPAGGALGSVPAEPRLIFGVITVNETTPVLFATSGPMSASV